MMFIIFIFIPDLYVSINVVLVTQLISKMCFIGFDNVAFLPGKKHCVSLIDFYFSHYNKLLQNNLGFVLRSY